MMMIMAKRVRIVKQKKKKAEPNLSLKKGGVYCFGHFFKE